MIYINLIDVHNLLIVIKRTEFQMEMMFSFRFLKFINSKYE